MVGHALTKWRQEDQKAILNYLASSRPNLGHMRHCLPKIHTQKKDPRFSLQTSYLSCQHQNKQVLIISSHLSMILVRE